MSLHSPGKAFRAALSKETRAALSKETPLQIVGTINANHALLAQRAGYQAIYLSGGGVAAGSLGLPDLGISTLDDVLTDIRRITDVCSLPLLVDADIGFGSSAFNVARTVKSMIKAGAAGLHIEDQVGAKAQRAGYQAIYLSGGGVAAGSLGLPDLGISTLDDVLTDIRRITDVCSLPLLVDADIGFGSSAFNVARTVKSMIKAGAAGLHIEDQVGAKRCGHRPNKAIVSKEEMVDRIRAAVDAKTDPDFVIMARTDALAVEGLDAAIERAQAYVEAGAEMLFPEAITELAMYRQFADAVQVPILMRWR